MTDFEGRTFEFMGEVGRFYDVISEKDHQVPIVVLFDHYCLWNIPRSRAIYKQQFDRKGN